MKLFTIERVKEEPQKLSELDMALVFPHAKAVPKSEVKME